jgi:ribosomal protein L37AE/L43A
MQLERGKRKRMPKPKCVFCHKEITERNRSARFCSRECSNSFNKISHRILFLLGYSQFEKFQKLGKNYRFPKKYDRFNFYYGLTEAKENA